MGNERLAICEIEPEDDSKPAFFLKIKINKQNKDNKYLDEKRKNATIYYYKINEKDASDSARVCWSGDGWDMVTPTVIGFHSHSH